MKMTTGSLFWNHTVRTIAPLPLLTEDTTCDVFVLGAGFGGTMSACLLAEQGVDTILMDQGTITSGSTMASTGLLQYSSDKHLTSCIHTFGEQNAVRFYQLCRQAISDMAQLCKRMSVDAQFHPRTSLYYASNEADVASLQSEFAALQKYGFDVEYWDDEQIQQHFAFSKPAGIYSRQNAEVNPVAITYGLAQLGLDHGLRIYEHSKVIRWNYADDHVMIYTRDHAIRANKIVFAKGYENAQITHDPNIVLESSFAIATEPVEDLSGWFEHAMIWETARPYLYLRTTYDQRIIIGGLDEPTIHPGERDAKLQHKGQLLLSTLQAMFPQLPNIERLQIAYQWSGIFGSTHDGYPILGEQPERFPHSYFIQAYGGNGFIYNTIAAHIIRDLIIRGSHPDAAMFQLYRQGPH